MRRKNVRVPRVQKEAAKHRAAAKQPVGRGSEDVPSVPQDDDASAAGPNKRSRKVGKEIGPSGIVWHTEQRRAGDLTEWDRNPRKLTESQAKHLAASIIKFGYVEPIQINSDNRIIGGHQRSRVMLQANLINYETMIDVRVPSRPLSEEEQEELAIRLNKNTGSWDYDILSTFFDQTSLREWGFSPMEFGMIGDSQSQAPKTPEERREEMKPTNLKPAAPKTCPHCGGEL